METTVTVSSGTIEHNDNMCSSEYDLIYYAYFVPNLFTNHIDIIGEAGFDKEYEKGNIHFKYYPNEDKVVCLSKYRITLVDDNIYNKYKNNIVLEHNNIALPWIRYPRTKDGVLIPQLIERIFNGRIPAKMVFMDSQ